MKLTQLKPQEDFKIVDWVEHCTYASVNIKTGVWLLSVPQNTHETEEEPSVCIVFTVQLKEAKW